MDRIDLKKEPKLFLTLDTCIVVNQYPRSFFETRYGGSGTEVCKDAIDKINSYLDFVNKVTGTPK